MSGPLEGIRVLDLSQGWAGPFCTMELGDLGADVIKVEPLDGDYTRTLGGPFIHGQSIPFLAVNRSKRSVAADYGIAEGAEIIRRLARNADAVVESFAPGEADRLGIGETALRDRNPSLIYATVTPFGQDGPRRHWAGSELVMQALGGLLPPREDTPIALGGEPLSFFTGKFLFHGITAALICRRRNGIAQRVDVSMLESALGRAMGLWPAPGADPKADALGPEVWASSARALQASDVQVEFNFRVQGYTPNDPAWMGFFRDIGADSLAGDSRFATEPDRSRNFAALKQALEPHLSRFTAQKIVDLVNARGGMAAPWNTIEMALDHPQAVALDMTIELQHPSAGRLRMVAPPYEFLGTPADVRMPPPTLGQHTVEVLRQAGFNEEEIGGLVGREII